MLIDGTGIASSEVPLCIEMTQQFSARIYKLGINSCMDVPNRISQAFGRRGCVPLAGTLNGHHIRATLVPQM